MALFSIPEDYPEISYNCFWGHSRLLYDNEGQEDFELDDTNIIRNPRFVSLDPFDPHLQPVSPCIDRGDPNSPQDPDGTRADIGRYFLHINDVESQDGYLPEKFPLYSIYPNPFNDYLNIELALTRDSPIEITIFDVSGRKIRHKKNVLAVYTSGKISFNTNDLISGDYFIQIQTNMSTTCKKITHLK